MSAQAPVAGDVVVAVGVVAATLLLSALALPARAAPLTEAELLQAAEDHPALGALRLQVQTAERVARQTGQLPPLGLRATVSQLDPMFTMRPMVMLMAEQPYPLGDQRQAEQAAAVAQAAVQDGQAFAVKGALRLNLRTAFAEYRGMVARQAVVAANVRAAEGLLAVHLKLMGAGHVFSGTRIATLQAEVARLQVESDVVAAALPYVRQRIAALVGWPAATAVEEPTLDWQGLQLPADPTQWADHPAQRQLQLAQAAALAQARMELAQTAPVLMPGAGILTMQDLPLGLLLTVGVTLPGLRPGAAQARAAQASAQVQALQLQGQAQERELRATWAKVKQQLAEVDKRRSGLRVAVLPALQRAVDAAVPALAAGSGSVTEIAEAAHRLHEVQLQCIDLDTQWLLLRAALWAVLETGRVVVPAVAQPASAQPMADIGGSAGMGM